MTACLAAGPDACASHDTAAVLLALGAGVVHAEPIHVTVGRGGSTRGRLPTGVQVHRSRPLTALDRAIVNGIPVTRPARILVDLAGCLRTEALAEVVDDTLVRHKTVTAASVLSVLERVQPRAGGPRLRAVLTPWMSGPQPQSPAEMRLLRQLVAAGLPMPKRQYEIFDKTGRFVARADLAYPEARIAIEYLGARHHGPRATPADERRRNRIIDADWLPISATADIQRDGLPLLVQTLARALSQRSPSPVRLRPATRRRSAS
jgi:hypothetical protein